MNPMHKSNRTKSDTIQIVYRKKNNSKDLMFDAWLLFKH